MAGTALPSLLFIPFFRFFLTVFSRVLVFAHPSKDRGPVGCRIDWITSSGSMWRLHKHQPALHHVLKHIPRSWRCVGPTACVVPDLLLFLSDCILETGGGGGVRCIQIWYVFIPVASQEELIKPRILDHNNRTRGVMSALPLDDNTYEMDTRMNLRSSLKRVRTEGSGFAVHSLTSVLRCLYQR
jgi:hypothetical protein